MPVQHSSKSSTWMTPPEIVGLVHRFWGGPPDLDPASSERANSFLRARRIITAEDDALVTPWRCEGETVFLNPPGGVDRAGRSMAGRFWGRMTDYVPRRGGPGATAFQGAIFLGFTLEILRTGQGYSHLHPGHFPMVIPSSRLRFWDPEAWERGRSPAHANVIIYVPGRVDATHRFGEILGELGTFINPRR